MISGQENRNITVFATYEHSSGLTLTHIFHMSETLLHKLVVFPCHTSQGSTVHEETLSSSVL